MALSFEQADLSHALRALGGAEFDALDSGVIGFDAATVVRRYKACESRAVGLSCERVLGYVLVNRRV